MDPSAQPYLAVFNSLTHVWTEFVQKWHLSICSWLVSFPRWTRLAAKKTSWNQGSLRRHGPGCRDYSGLALCCRHKEIQGLVVFTCWVKWEKLISGFGLCCFSIRHSLVQFPSILHICVVLLSRCMAWTWYLSIFRLWWFLQAIKSNWKMTISGTCVHGIHRCVWLHDIAIRLDPMGFVSILRNWGGDAQSKCIANLGWSDACKECPHLKPGP